MSVLVRYNDGTGWRTTLLVREGRRWLHIMQLEYPLRVTQVPLSEGQYMRVMDYSLAKAVKVFKRLAKQDYGTLGRAPNSVKEALAG